MSKSLTVDGNTIKYQIWDTAGQERVRFCSTYIYSHTFIHPHMHTLFHSYTHTLIHMHTHTHIVQYRSLLPMYYRNAAAAVIVYDITNESTFEVLQEWITELHRLGPQNIVLAIAGNKCDLEDKREVSGHLFSLPHTLQ